MASKSNTAVRRRLVSAWISTVISLSLVLLLVGTGAMLLVNARAVSDYFKENMQISVLLKDSVSDADAAAFESGLAQLPGIRSTRLISREEGLAEMTELLGRNFLDVFKVYIANNAITFLGTRVGNAINPDVDHGRSRLHHIGSHKMRLTDRGN